MWVKLHISTAPPLADSKVTYRVNQQRPILLSWLAALGAGAPALPSGRSTSGKVPTGYSTPSVDS